jgi:uncharacterized protein (DUF433 family)
MATRKQEREPEPLLDINSVIAAFSEEQVERITRLGNARLRYWARTEFFKPSYVEENQRLPYSRFYSFKDIVALRTLELLRVQNNVPLQHLRKVAEKLSHLRNELWTKTTLFVFNRKVVFVNPDAGIPVEIARADPDSISIYNGRPEEVLSGQYILGIPLKKIVEDTSADIIAISQRPADKIGRVSRDRSICHNAWVIAGTRIPIGAVRRLHEDGYSTDDIIKEYPDLTPKDIEAALRHKDEEAA